ncbi:MAG TPA: LUD domain-containing protein [Acidobacteriaceae bacterium]
MSDARTAILRRIVEANSSQGTAEAAAESWELLPRDYSVVSQRSRADVLELLQDRLRDYDAAVVRCEPALLTMTLNATLTAASVHRIGIPQGLQELILPAGFEFVIDEGMSPSELDGLDAVLTGCILAIAETGTLVLQSTIDHGRRALTLVPDVHVCLVRSADVVETVPQAFARLQPTATMPTTFVSGPSATADIEMTRVKGVHGPRFLHVILIHDDAAT